MFWYFDVNRNLKELTAEHMQMQHSIETRWLNNETEKITKPDRETDAMVWLDVPDRMSS
jgi:hypothetical protein